MPISAAVYGCQGTQLLEEERDFFRASQPFGFILFARNVSIPEQVRALCHAMREAVGRNNAPIFIDQEGGRVARLKPPFWRERKPGRRFGALYETAPGEAREAAYLSARLTAHELYDVGITVNCVPVLDIPVPGAHDIIGDRAYANDAATVIALGRAVVEGALDGGVLPVIKHIPGHGRAGANSHLVLPRVAASAEELSARDFVPFKSLSDAPIAMTAHVVYEALDPVRPATTSPKVIRDVIRGEIGFAGLLVSDDLSMAALEGPLGARAKAAFSAGCDIALHCNGRMDEMREIADEVNRLEGASLARAEAAIAWLHPPKDFDREDGKSRLAQLLGQAA